MWYPIRLWYTGEDSIGPHACQADGFFAALSIEAGDFAVLAIAIHTYVFVMYPQVQSSGSANKYGGLFKYRRILFFAWAIFSILFAALPFVKSGEARSDASDLQEASLGYIQLTTWCYLPISPIWYRLVLAWVPRYIVLFTICAIYIGVYRYVRKVLRKVEVIQHGVQTLPLDISAADNKFSDENDHITSMNDVEKQLRNDENCESSLGDEDIVVYNLELSADDANHFESNVQFHTHLRKESQLIGNVSAGSLATARPLVNNNLVSPRQFVRKTIRIDISEQDRQRTAVLRQVKYLLLYPIFYVIMWAPPFVEQCLMYTSYYQSHPVAWLGYISAFMYGISGFFNTFIFAFRETPWRTGPTLIRQPSTVDDGYAVGGSPFSVSNESGASESIGKETAETTDFQKYSATHRLKSALSFSKSRAGSTRNRTEPSTATLGRCGSATFTPMRPTQSRTRTSNFDSSPASSGAYSEGQTSKESTAPVVNFGSQVESESFGNSSITPFNIMKVRPTTRKPARARGDWLDNVLDDIDGVPEDT